jgi:cytidylate kinase
MPIIAITNKFYTGSEKIIQALGQEFNCPVVTDLDIVKQTHKTYRVKRATLKKVIENKPIAFNTFSHEREKCLSALKKTLSDLVGEGDAVLHGCISHLIPREISHVMRILIIEKREKRVARGMAMDRISEKQALKRMERSDRQTLSWTLSLFGKNPWDEALYDRVLYLGKLDLGKPVPLVSDYFKPLVEKNKILIEQEINDFKLAADIDMALSDIGKGLLVTSFRGQVLVTIDKKVKRLTAIQQKIIQTVEACPGVTRVEIKIGKNFYK